MEAIHGERRVADFEAPTENLALELYWVSGTYLLDISKEIFRKQLKMGNRVLEMGLSERHLKSVRWAKGARCKGLNESLVYLNFKHFW